MRTTRPNRRIFFYCPVCGYHHHLGDCGKHDEDSERADTTPTEGG